MLSDFVARHLGSDFGEDLRIHDGRIDLVHHLVTVHISPRIFFVSKDSVDGVHRKLSAFIQNTMRRKRRDDLFDGIDPCEYTKEILLMDIEKPGIATWLSCYYFTFQRYFFHVDSCESYATLDTPKGEKSGRSSGFNHLTISGFFPIRLHSVGVIP